MLTELQLIEVQVGEEIDAADKQKFEFDFNIQS